VIQTEDGLGTMDTARFPLATSFQQVLESVSSLLSEDHKFSTVVLDSLDWCERLIHEQVRTEQGQSIFSEYGKGYVFALAHFERLIAGLNALRDRKGMTVVIVAHSIVKRFEAPDLEPYDRYLLDIHQKAAAIVEEWCDALLFASQRMFTQSTEAGFGRKVTRGVGTGERIMLTESRPAHVGKNRYQLPYEMPLDWKAFSAAVGAAYKQKTATAEKER
jgi:hypothetical protein